MRIFDLLFASHAVCIGCGRKKRRGDFFITDGAAGLCSECSENLKRTRRGQSFEALSPVSYLLSPFEYSGAIVTVLRNFKFRSDFKNGDILARLIEDFAAAYPHLKEFDAIIPVPLSRERMNDRGFNQAEIIARAISRAVSVPVDTCTLVRTRNTRRQSDLTALERRTNIINAFEAVNDLTDKKIIIADDVYTTGITMRTCAAALKRAGAADVIGFSAAVRIPGEKERRDFEHLRSLSLARIRQQGK
ncbi:MAG TPA: ComF family protein [Candidatus Ornithomonoglobus intestinigallinarum]|uniref:ComF family protein n=1 Tax=Candidatus Ornithomonoglobus intestinigallinarum TaxID=2840894 RepID=A0A9D1H447_9FIRM|nr:ComF family protein [Candidatus Ornithomonoglobus intestinigallinarum]